MSNASYSRAADVTHKQPKPGPGMLVLHLFMCGHRGKTTGAVMRGRVPWKCANCVKDGK